jgi:hypothetical protein
MSTTGLSKILRQTGLRTKRPYLMCCMCCVLVACVPDACQMERRLRCGDRGACDRCLGLRLMWPELSAQKEGT